MGGNDKNLRKRRSGRGENLKFNKKPKSNKGSQSKFWRQFITWVLFPILFSVASLCYFQMPIMQSMSHYFPSLQNNDLTLNFDFIEEDAPMDWNSSDPTLIAMYDFLTNYVCQDAKGYCHRLLKAAPSRRTHYVAPTSNGSAITKGETILILPRHLLIWDLDALRDEFIRKELFHARHSKTGNSLDSGAFLAVHLLKRTIDISQKKGKGGTIKNADESMTDEKFLQFMNILPKYDDLVKYHPILWPKDKMETLLGKHTTAYHLLEGHQHMISSEYDALSKASKLFQHYFTEIDYVSMRINVISRSFGPGPPDQRETVANLRIDDELAVYYAQAGVDLKKGCRAMSPILDMWDHHANPNVEWFYQKNSRSFVIRALNEDIPANQDIMVSYGKFTDSHLFTKFGFVNGDGSGYTEASIAVMHPLLDYGMGAQFSYLKRNELGVEPLKDQLDDSKILMANYLRFDDGNSYCIDKMLHPEAYQLKLLKYKHLIKIANKYDRWTVTIQPRNATSKPALSSHLAITDEPPKYDSKDVKFNGIKIISTCRLIALTVDDYQGNAIEVLTKALDEDVDFFIEKQSDQLEFRALTTLARLTTGAIHLYPRNVPQEMASISSSSYPFQSEEWTAAHVRLGEMQSLEVLRSVATSGAKEMKKRVKAAGHDEHGNGMYIHSVTCPAALTEQLLKDVNL